MQSKVGKIDLIEFLSLLWGKLGHVILKNSKLSRNDLIKILQIFFFSINLIFSRIDRWPILPQIFLLDRKNFAYLPEFVLLAHFTSVLIIY